MTSRLLTIAGAHASTSVRRASSKSAGLTSQVTAVLGAQWGDEGKGKLVDVLAAQYDLIARFNGGANAGHTVIANGHKFAFHLLPCGLIYPHTHNLLGNGTVVHIPSLFHELEPLTAAGIDWKGRLFISNRAHVLFDFHKAADGAMEERLKGVGKAIGTTKQGIGPAYVSKAARHAVRMVDLLNRSSFQARLKREVEEHAAMYGIPIDAQAELDKYDALIPMVEPMIVDGVHKVHSMLADGKRVLAEGANAAMLDVDFGTYPYVTSSSTTAGGICTGLGLPPAAIQTIVGVVKAYTTRVGGGPFPTELTDERGGGDRPLNSPGTDVGLHLQQVGREIGVTTGRKRRCGWFDAVVARYAHTLNRFASFNLTKLDVLDELDEVKIGVSYSLDGRELPPGAFPASLEDLSRVQVAYETLPGWKTSIAKARKFSDLPPPAQAYVKRIEEVTGVRVSYIGVGPGRDDMVTRGFKLA